MKLIIFLWIKTFEQIEIKKEIVGDKGKLLTENLQVSVSFIMKTRYQLNYLTN